MSSRLAPPLRAAAASVSAVPSVDVFLCHNSKDKPLVRQVAEGLELEFGIPHFLDVYAIPAGEAFLPWIDNALATSSGCAIFLGANGWGETHFWEAERALDRYRRAPGFRLIPVALPGIRDEDMQRLGAGTLFSEINWADFRSGVVDPDAIAKLRAALLGQAPEAGRGPSRLTPYVVRRDAGRWERSGRRDRSILYRGRQLDEAEALREAQPDLVAGDAIVAFLSASATAQTRQARRVAALAVVVAVVVVALALRTEAARRLALSWFVAAEARQAASPDTGLLLAVQATRISGTPEAFGALLERMDAQPYLHHMARVGNAEVRSLAFAPGGEALYVGGDDGRIVRIDLRTFERTLSAAATGAAVTALDVDAEAQEVWAGTQDGRVVVHEAGGRTHDIAGLTGARAGAPGQGGLPILSLQIDPGRRSVAIGDYGHRLLLLDRARRTVVWQRRLAAQRVTAVSFSADGQQLAAASSEGLVEVFDAATGEPVAGATRTTARTGHPVAVQFARNGDLRVIDDGLGYSVFRPGSSLVDPPPARQLPGTLLSAAAIGPRRESGPMQRRDLIVLGHGSGDVSFTPIGGDDLLPVRAHARAVQAVALSADGRLAATGASDGSVALWDLQRRSSLMQPRLAPGGELAALAYAQDGQLIAVTTSQESAALSRHTSQGWKEVADLMSLSASAAGPETVQAPPGGPDAEGFEVVPDKVLVHAVFDAGAHHLAWTTRGGAVLWSALPMAGPPLVLRRQGPPIDAIALSDSGRYLFVAGEDGGLDRFDASRPQAPRRRHRLPATARTMQAAQGESAVFAALDDGTLRRIDFSRVPVAETLHAALPGTAGQLARLAGSDSVLAGGAGSSAGIDVGLVRRGAYQRLHSRRLGGAASAVALSQAADLVAVADHDGSLHLWALGSLTPMASLKASARPVGGVVISADARRMAFWDLDGDVYELALERERWRDAACRLVQRELTSAEWTPLVPDTALRPGCTVPTSRREAM